MSRPSSIHSLLSERPCSQPVLDYITHLSSFIQSDSPSNPEVKSYPDVVYYNYYALGLSFVFKPLDGYKPKMGLTRSDLTEDKLILDSLDLYNIPETSTPENKPRSGPKKKAEIAFATHPVSPVTLTSTFEVARETTGKDFVHHFGEPDRKGGGSGPSSGSIGIWCEWTKCGILVEFGGVEAVGPQAWERGKDAVWKVITVFSPKE
ncbi:hypothetical protein GYMLUDRAFT_150027 [Collybiopsis luxurians FD-317 M1]|nr:hypothetical protein GYMLUDRAFT_150027 [Collybiopsis luxurians FD-317 M1]